jgi:uncharacterized repeat protein (TIGR01451 family)
MSIFSFLFSRKGKKTRTRGQATGCKAMSLQVEMLEDRAMPSGMQTLVETAVFPTSVTPTPTNFNLPGSVQQFDPSLGVLQSVVITEQGTINSTIGVENTSSSSSSQITATVSGKLEVTGPGVDLVVNPSDNLATFSATTFDGKVDFGGTSGKTYPTSSANGTQSVTLTGSAINAFVSSGTGKATGTVSLTEIGQGTSTATGSGGNLVVTTTNTASAIVTVTYNFLPLSSLSGNVYWDMGGGGSGSAGYNDGSFESNESGIANVPVQLTGTDYRGNSVSLTVDTDQHGAYSFANLQPGTYTLSKNPGVPGVPGAIDGKDTIGTQGGNVAENQFSNINLQANVNGVNNNFGELTPPPGNLSGYVYYDTGTGFGSATYNDGIREAGEPPPKNPVYIYLIGTDYTGQAVNAYTATDANGHYSFTNLKPGAYAIMRGTVTDPGAIDGKDAVGSLGGKLLGNEFYNIALTGGANGTDYNFGLLPPPPPPPPPPPASLSGFVYYDTGTGGPGSSGYNDGIKEGSEKGIGGVYVYLIGTTFQGQTVNTYTQTDGSGFYNFGNLAPGGYAIIKGPVPNPNAVDGKTTIGSQGGKSIQNEIYNIGLAGGVNGSNNNFGELLPGVVGGDFPDVSITKTASASQVLIGGALTYTITASNVGTSDATGLTVTDVLPNGSGLYNWSGNGWTFAVNGQTMTATLPFLAEGAQSSFTIGIYAPGVPGNITNNVTLTETSPDSDLNDKHASVTTPVIAPPAVPFPPAVFAIPPGGFSKSQLLGTGGFGSLSPALQEQLVYVESLYRTLDGPSADQGGLVNFVQQLQGGASLAQIVQQFWTSPQQRAAEVAYYFHVFYHRAPTAGEITTWTNIFNAGYSENTVQWMLASSSEYNANHPTDASFVNGLYLDALGRSASGSEEASWQAYIAGHGRSAAAYAILHLNEYFAHQVNIVYNAWLSRAPTAGELNNWVSQLAANQIGLANVYQSILSSQEFYSMAVRKTGVA